jgi:PAS domain S-box-containing protein
MTATRNGRPRRRPSYPSPRQQFAGLLLVLGAILLYDVLAQNFPGFRGWGNLLLLVVLFVTYWSGMRAGLVATAMVLVYMLVATAMPWSSMYGRPDLETRMLTAGIAFGLLVVIVGLVQNKLRAMAIKAYDAAGEATRAQDELVRSEALRSIVVDAAMDAIVAIDADGRVTLWNPSAEKMFGWSSAEAVGQELASLIIPETYREAHREGLARFRETGEGRIFGSRLELPAQDKAGTEVQVELAVVPHKNGDGTVFIGFLRDVSLQKKMQRELLQAKKLESVGQLAGGVAHDFNNVLSVIMGYTELAKNKIAPDDPVQTALDEVLEAADRSSKITRQLLAFARQQVTEPKVISLNEVITGIRGMMTKLIREDIELVFLPADDLWPVKADPGQVEQLLTNLVINARDAMPKGGRLLIETRNITLEADEALPVPDLQPGDYVTLSVTDTGVGIAREHLDRVFEPFFTTKGSDQGSGLGLASAYGIARQAGGHISVYSEPGHGTMFRVYVPRTFAEGGTSEQRRASTPAARGTETILVAEDSPQVRAVIEKTLDMYGYSVLSASSGEEALALAKEGGRRIDLLVTDVVMPRMSGWDLAKQMRAASPDLRVLFLSGYSEEAVNHGGMLAEGDFLQKPVLPTELAAKVRSVLDSRGAGARSSLEP